MSCALLCWKTQNTARNIGYKNYGASSSFQMPATTAAASQGVLSKPPGYPHVSNKQKQSRMYWRNGLALPGCNLWLSLAGMLLLSLQLQQSSQGELKPAEGWVCSHCSPWPLGWFNHSIKPQPETADRKQMGPSLLPPSKLFLLTWWDKTAQHGWVKHHCSKGDGAALCNWKWTFQTGSSAWLLGKWSLRDCPQSAFTWSAEESLYKIHHDNVPLFPTASKRTLSFCSALAAVRPH